MTRIRTLKPEWLEDEKLAALSDTARLLSAGLILLADDQGRGRANPALIAAHVWPYEQTPPIARASTALTALVGIKFVALYTVGGQRYFQIRNWPKHQLVHNPSEPRLPGPEEHDGEDVVDVPLAPKDPPWQPPEWVPVEPWAAFTEMRRKMCATLTTRAMQLVVKSLEKLRAGGHDPGRVLEQSVERGWRGVFPLSTNGSHQPKPEATSRVQPPPASEVFKKWETT